MRGTAAVTVLVLMAMQPAQAAQAGADTLLRAARAYATAAYRGEQTVVTWSGRHVAVSLASVERDPPDWTRLEYTPVGSSHRSVVIRRGTDEIRFDPVARTGTRSAYLPTEGGDVFSRHHLSWLMANYRVTAAPRSIAGRSTTRVELVPVGSDRPTRLMDIDGETGVVLRSERIGVDGQLAELTTFVTFQVMPRGWRAGAAIPPDLRLERQPRPRSVTATDAAWIFGATPREVAVPEGFHRVGDYVTETDRKRVLQTVYSDGLTTLVVYQRRGTIPRPAHGSRLVRAPGGPLWVEQHGLRTLVYWSSEGWLVTVVGDVTPKVLIQSAHRTGVAAAPRLWERIADWMVSRLHAAQ